MAPAILQNGGFILGLIGAASLIAATATNRWSMMDRRTEVVTSIYTFKGLWQDCETNSAGMTECRPIYGLLGFSGSFQAVRALMIVGVVLSVIGALISVFSLTCLTMNSMSESSKAKMSLTAGIMFIIAGICGIAGASVYANQIVATYRLAINKYYAEQFGGNQQGGVGMPGMDGAEIYTFGPALFVAWVGGGVLIVGGVLKSLAFREMVKDGKSGYPGVVYKPQARTRTDTGDHHSEGGKRDPNYV